MFELFTDDARRIVVHAQEESRLLRHDRIGTEHLLLGMLHDDSPTSAALGEVGVSPAAARDRIGQSDGHGRKEPSGHVPFTPRAKQVLERSLRHAQRLGQDYIAGPHLLRALLDVRDGTGSHTLIGLGVDLDRLAVRADELASFTPAGSETYATSSAPRPGQRPRRLRSLYEPQSIDDAAARLADALGQRDALAHAIRRYGRHAEDCDRARGCTCGWQDLLDGLEPPDATPPP